MHHALLISELVRVICSALDEPSDLLALAQTCRALHDPALDELWRDLYSIYPFVHLLAQCTPGESEETFVPTLEQWATLRKYSARTRSLYMCMIDDLPYHFPCLSNPPDPDSFFPNVRTIAWYPNDHLSMLPFLRLLCGPALNTLSAEFAIDPPNLEMVADLGTLCPNITDISISAASEIPNDGLASTLSTSICRWKDLKHVSCDDLSLLALEHLGQSRNLESLTTSALGRFSSSSAQPFLDTQGLSFPSLRYLHLYTSLLSSTATALGGLRLSLKEFRLDLFDAEELFPGSSCWRDLFAALAGACSHARLVKLSICVINPPLPSSGGPSTTIRDTRPLLSFTQLRVVSLEGLSSLSLDDDDVAEMASAWPHVEELSLSTYVDHPTASLPTFRSLVCLAQSCPKLRSLALVVDMTSIDASSLCTAVAGHNHNRHDENSNNVNEDDGNVTVSILDELCLGNSPFSIRSLTAAAAVAAHALHRLYPALKQVDLSVWNKEPLNRLPRRERYELCWATVNGELQSVRWRNSAAEGALAHPEY